MKINTQVPEDQNNNLLYNTPSILDSLWPTTIITTPIFIYAYKKTILLAMNHATDPRRDILEKEIRGRDENTIVV